MKTIHRNTNVGILIIALMLLTLVGFYPTYISKFPSFENITNVQHFHGAVMMLWFSVLVVQPFLIRLNKYKIHRIVGKLSYGIAPLVLYSIFLASKHEYYDDTTYLTRDESLAGLALDKTSLVAFGICYILGIVNIKNTPLHIRYMVSTALIIMGPGIMRIIAIYEIFGDINFPTVVLYSYLLCACIGGGLIGYDLIKSNPYKPYLLAVALTMGIYLTYLYRMSDWWLSTAEAISALF